jgi:hypothetical protein
MMKQAPPARPAADISFFDTSFGSYDYDVSFNMLLEAQLNLPQFNSTGS